MYWKVYEIRTPILLNCSIKLKDDLFIDSASSIIILLLATIEATAKDIAIL